VGAELRLSQGSERRVSARRNAVTCEALPDAGPRVTPDNAFASAWNLGLDELGQQLE
jgi:hypothetical protein